MVCPILYLSYFRMLLRFMMLYVPIDHFLLIIEQNSVYIACIINIDDHIIHCFSILLLINPYIEVGFSVVMRNLFHYSNSSYW